jgi:hypothetical protein
MDFKRFKSPVSLVALVLIILTISVIKLRNPQHNILSWDTFGFYLYLPATFIYDDPGIRDVRWIEEINATYNNTATLYQLAPTHMGTNVIRFTPGMAIMMSPFFLAGHAYASLSEIDPADGFSDPYQWAIILCGLFYTIVGLVFLRKVLLRFVSDRVAAITLAILCISSNFFFFITYGNDVPHVYAFTLNVIIIWLSLRWHESRRPLHAILLGLVLGLAVISRISEVIMLAVPVFWGVYNRQTLIDKIGLLWRYRLHLLYLVLAGIIAVLPQLAYWKMASGGWLFNAYNDPGSSLDLLNPRFYYVLFGFRKGLFIYSPVMILAVAGFWYLYKKKKQAFLPVLLVTLAHTYLIASFTSLVAYGWRAFIELYALLAIPLALLIAALEKSRLPVRIAVYALLLFFTVLNLFQAWQLNNGILDGYRMTKDYYCRIFFKTKISEEDRKYMLVQRPFTAQEKLGNEEDFNRKLLRHFDFETPQPGEEQYYDTTYARSGKMSFRLEPGREYSPTFREPFNEISNSYYGWVRASVWIYPVANPLENEAALVIAFRHGNQNYKYKGFSMNADTVGLQMNQWNLVRADYMTPELLSAGDKLEVYVWFKKGTESIWIDDLKIEFFDPKYQ